MNRLRFVTCTMLILTLASTAVCAQPNFTQNCQAPKFPSAEQTVADNSCPAAGNGGKEALQNQAKNNFCAPLPIFPISFQRLLNLQKKVEQDGTINFGSSGPTINRLQLRQIGEGRLVSLIGYVLIARQEGKESVNCGANVPNAAVRHDIHISIVAIRREQNECHSVVVEMSPHHRPAEWTAANVERLAALNVPVRVIGDLFFDSSHVPCEDDQRVGSNPARFSLWEIHPIYKFEVCTANCNTPKSAVWTDFSKVVQARSPGHGIQ
jgi:hypothetical protein